MYPKPGLHPEQCTIPPRLLSGPLRRLRARRACRKAGGHWWHHVDPMGLWACCGCGAERVN